MRFCDHSEATRALLEPPPTPPNRAPPLPLRPRKERAPISWLASFRPNSQQHCAVLSPHQIMSRSAAAGAAPDDGAATAPPETSACRGGLTDAPAAPMSTKKRVEALYNVMGTIEVTLLWRRSSSREQEKIDQTAILKISKSPPPNQSEQSRVPRSMPRMERDLRSVHPRASSHKNQRRD